MDDVKNRREEVVITKHGEPVPKPVPVEIKSDGIVGFFQGKGRISGNVLSPALDSDEWGNLR